MQRVSETETNRKKYTCRGGGRDEGGHGEKEKGRMVREDEMRDDEQGVKGKK